MTSAGVMQRRTVLKGLGAAAALGLSPREARAAGTPFKILTAAEGATLEAVGEALLPGARESGIAHFVDAQLGVPAPDCLLILRYFDWPPPYLPFYRATLAALDQAAGGRFAKLTPAKADALIGDWAQGKITPWQAPPAMLGYLALRSDAVDVTYGTVEGFEKLGIPYMPHILPTQKW